MFMVMSGDIAAENLAVYQCGAVIHRRRFSGTRKLFIKTIDYQVQVNFTVHVLTRSSADAHKAARRV